MKLGLILRKYRAHEELTRAELCEQIGISETTLFRVERGENMDGDTLAKIITWLLTEM